MTKTEYAQYLFENKKTMDLEVLKEHKWSAEEILDQIMLFANQEVVIQADKNAIHNAFAICK